VVTTLSGIEFLNALIKGDLPAPPISRLMDFRVAQVSEGSVLVTCIPQEFHYNPIGVVHGGLAATLLDTAMACAIQTRLPLGTVYTTVELHVNLIRAIHKDTGELRCTGEALHVGRSVATAQGRLTDAAGKLYAHGTTTCLVMSAS
jgi:uncharacterized protein (TIGR00369 family)